MYCDASCYSANKAALQENNVSVIPSSCSCSSNIFPYSIREDEVRMESLSRARRMELLKTMRCRQNFRKVIGAIVIMCVIVCCQVVILIIVSNSTKQQANSWLAKYIITLAQDLLVNQFLKGLIQSWLIKKASRISDRSSKCRKVLLLLIDKVVLRAVAT